ncbi:MAG: hypothetical protein OXG51_12760 [Gammaproteobacteria bacterium]|nr:hypothetical protein [Gammaproteobacteria bacterium]
MQPAGQAFEAPDSHVPPLVPVQVIGGLATGLRWVLGIAGWVVVVGVFRAASNACAGSYDWIVVVLQWSLFGFIAASLLTTVAKGASGFRRRTDDWLRSRPLLPAVLAAAALWIVLTVVVWQFMTDWVFGPIVSLLVQVIGTLGGLGNPGSASLECPLPA